MTLFRDELNRVYRMMPRFLRRVIGFAAAGGAAFAVDAGILMALIHYADMDPVIARFFSAPPAIFVNWLINRTYAFLPINKISVHEFGKFVAAKFVGNIANIAGYAALMMFSPIALHPLIALIIATAGSAILNFLILHYFVYPSEQSRSLI